VTEVLGRAATWLRSGWFGDREVVNAWFGGAPSFVALDCRVLGSRGCGDPSSDTVAAGAPGRLAGLVWPTLGVSLSAGGSGPLWMIDSGSTHSAHCCGSVAHG
jgi:hypothetical protein